MKKGIMTLQAVLLSLIILWGSTWVQAETCVDDAAQDKLIQYEVMTAVSMLQAIYEKHQQGDMTLAEAKKLGADLLRELRYGKEGYFWADTKEGVNVVLYGKDVEGKNRLDAKDTKGTHFIREFMEIAKTGGGYVEYWFPKKRASESQPKRSYVQAFEPFGWVIGTGYYPPMIADKKNDPAFLIALAQVHLFSGLTRAHREALTSVATLRRGKAGERIIEQGTVLDKMFIAMEGKAEVLVNQKRILTFPGQNLFGEIEFLDKLPASATVTLVKDTDIIELDCAALTRLMEKEPQLGYLLMKEIAKIESQRLRLMD